MNPASDEHLFNSPPAGKLAAGAESACVPTSTPAPDGAGQPGFETAELERKVEIMIEEVLSSQKGDWLSTIDTSRAQYDELVFPAEQRQKDCGAAVPRNAKPIFPAGKDPGLGKRATGCE
jgi:hypothetical protein